MAEFAYFLQDSIRWKRLELFPGGRLSYDDFSDNLNLAPRFSASYDVFDNQRTVLFFGRNRYFSGTQLTYGLYSNTYISTETRESSELDWTTTRSYHYATSDLKTPYADEVTLGIIQQLFGGEFKIQYIDKKNRDEFAREKIDGEGLAPDTYRLNNRGRTDYESIQLSWQRWWTRHFLDLNATWQKTATSHTSYLTQFDSDDQNATLWYEGEEIYKYELPRTDFNRPYLFNLMYSFKVNDQLTLSSVTRVRGPYYRHMYAGEKRASELEPEQGEVLVYEKKKSHTSVTFDWHLRWAIPYPAERQLILALDALNIFNKRLKVGYDSGNFGYSYELGRQIWAGLEYRF